MELTVGTRAQWNNLPGQPVGYFAMAQLPLPFLSAGLGVGLQRDEVGFWEQTEINAQYAQFVDQGSWRLSIGMAAGLMQAGLRGDRLRTPEGSYPNGAPPMHGDGRLPTVYAQGSSGAIHAGIALESGSWQGGVTVRHLQGGRLRFAGSEAGSGVGIRPHLLAYLNYAIEAGQLEIRPELGVLADKAVLQADTRCLFTWHAKAMVGVGVRGWNKNSADALLWQGGVWISERFLLVCSYESGLSGLRNAHTGSFELLLRYALDPWAGKGRLPGRIFNPRFL